jgi:hypothetical protein
LAACIIEVGAQKTGKKHVSNDSIAQTPVETKRKTRKKKKKK